METLPSKLDFCIRKTVVITSTGPEILLACPLTRIGVVMSLSPEVVKGGSLAIKDAATLETVTR
jgi:hypothetical protein